MNCSFSNIARLILDNGGKVVDLDAPQLTHVVVDKRDESRRLELIKLTVKYAVILSHRTCVHYY